MREEGKKPTEAAFVGVLRAAEDLGQIETAKQAFEYRMEVGLPPQEYAYVKVSEQVGRFGGRVLYMPRTISSTAECCIQCCRIPR